jgi:2-amino-4-hydroxy-6-hydroxymethyldihydropteridine diphosphokinase
MPCVWLSIGSNIDRERMIPAALDALRRQFGKLVLSPVYQSPAEGFVGEPFYNLVAGINTDMPLPQLHRVLKAIEDQHGRVRDAAKFSSRTLDIDVLTYGDYVGDEGGKQIPRDEILKYAFVLKPLVDVAANELHPALKVTYAELWQQFSGNKESLELVAMNLAS